MKSRSNTMGTSVYPVSEKYQEEMEAELKTSALDENMRRCEIACWKAVFKYCTNVNIDDLQWTDVKLGTKQFQAGSKQYVLYYVSYSKYADSTQGNNTMKRLYLPTYEDAMNVHSTLSYFMKHWNMGYDGGELSTYIGWKIFIHDEASGYLIGNNVRLVVDNFVARCTELRLNPCSVVYCKLPKQFYDEYMLTVLRITGFKPRIECKNRYTSFFSGFMETDEKTVRDMGHVKIKDV